MAPDITPVLHLLQVSFSYAEAPLFTALSAEVMPGVTLVQGGDGRGKSTLLRLMACELSPKAGELKLRGGAVPDARTIFWNDPRNARNNRFDELTPPQYFDTVRQQFPALDEDLLTQLIADLSLTDHLHKQLFMLSTGSKRKVWLAAGLASGAVLTLLDEPFNALDAPSIAQVIAHLQKASQQTRRAVVIADYSAPRDVTLAGVIDLGD